MKLRNLPKQGRLEWVGKTKDNVISDLALHIFYTFHINPLGALVAFPLLELMLLFLAWVDTRDNSKHQWR